MRFHNNRYANWDGSKAGKQYNAEMRVRLKKAQLLFRSGECGNAAPEQSFPPTACLPSAFLDEVSHDEEERPSLPACGIWRIVQCNQRVLSDRGRTVRPLLPSWPSWHPAAGLGIPLVGETKARLLWIIKSAYEGNPAFTGKQWYVTRYRMAQNFRLLESDWELDAFSVTLTAFKTFPDELTKPREKLPEPQEIAVELLQVGECCLPVCSCRPPRRC
eukprot:SAG22_NODE_828_length_6952_cov_8.477240_2_plen_217_part_00